MTAALERIKEIEKFSGMDPLGLPLSPDGTRFLLRAFKVMREIAANGCADDPGGWLETEFEERMKDANP